MHTYTTAYRNYTFHCFAVPPHFPQLLQITVCIEANNENKVSKCCLLALFLFSDVRTVVVLKGKEKGEIFEIKERERD